ncbi:sugar MFS transporter [Pontibacter burrus]|uniref:Sugar MFS transporter n=1 Tax=Pontibacter burrus TaxID=2704466 RepID=A0A6B3LRN8_9BACT|nr:sugar MFS transporter [Pontibacter burrus]NEM98493.1 sugar MFS transporter [Pontibacter burrus]
MSAKTEFAMPQELEKRNDSRAIYIIGALFFIFGSVTWLNSVLIPYLKIACELTIFESYFVTFAFYISYFVMAIPSAWVLKAIGFKKGMAAGLAVMALGALVFIPAATERTYSYFLLGLFVQGTGLALLQTASNPYITILGPAESAAKRISVMGICNKVGGIIAPIVLGFFIFSDASELDALVAQLNSMSVEQKAAELNALAHRVINPYIFMAVALGILAVLVLWSSLPEIDTDHEDETVALANTGKTSVLQFPHLLLGVLALFLYVGVEVIAVDTIISYGMENGFSLTDAKFFSSFTLGAMLVGYVIGIITIPKYLKQDVALKISAILGVLFSLGAILTSGYTSVLFIALLGLANSLMWPAIWPLAIVGLGRFTKIGSSLLIMGIAGGAILPLVYGKFAESTDTQHAYWMMVPCYLFIWYYATKGHKVGRKI